jgi:hypothetical protein
MDPRLLYVMVRQEQSRRELEADRQRLARAAAGPRRPGAPRRAVGHLLVRAGLWLLIPAAGATRSVDRGVV